MKRTKYKYHFDGIRINNRWKRPIYSRGCNWVYFGVSERWFGPDQFAYSIHLFGIDINIWIKLEAMR